MTWTLKIISYQIHHQKMMVPWKMSMSKPISIAHNILVLCNYNHKKIQGILRVLKQKAVFSKLRLEIKK